MWLLLAPRTERRLIRVGPETPTKLTNALAVARQARLTLKLQGKNPGNCSALPRNTLKARLGWAWARVEVCAVGFQG